MATLPNLDRYGMTWSQPPAHVVPELSAADKQVKLAGNGNPPAVEEFIMRRVVEAMDAA